MFVKQSDLLLGLDEQFIKDFTDSGLKKTHPEGHRLFNTGDAADSFYILTEGRIRISVGEEEDDKTTYIVHAGEGFGWSGLVGFERYTGSAECIVDSSVIAFDNKSVKDLAESDPANGLRFYRRLARMLGDRLIHSYYHDDTDAIYEGLVHNNPGATKHLRKLIKPLK